MTIGSATGGATDGVRPDRGGGVVLALGLIGATMILSLAVIAWGGAALARHRAEAAADLAALAAASAVPAPSVESAGSVAPVGQTSHAVCSLAARVVAADGADLAGCLLNADGSVTVRVTVSVAGLGRATAAARAGQPPGPEAPS
jgi:secretion/DNA translocation related TadE-like protein